MGLTKRRDSYYVEFHVRDDGKTLSLASAAQGGKLKRWKVGSLNKTVTKQQEAMIKTDLMKGVIKGDNERSMTFEKWVMAERCFFPKNGMSWRRTTFTRSLRDRRRWISSNSR